MTTEYLDLADYLAIAQAVTGLDLQTVMNMTNHDLADSALHAPAAGVGDTDFYPECSSEGVAAEPTASTGLVEPTTALNATDQANTESTSPNTVQLEQQ